MTTAPTLYFDTPDYILRTLVRGDEDKGWGAWLADPRLAENLNAKPRTRTMAELTAFIDKYDRVKRHLLGIFSRADNRMVGIRTIEIDAARRAFYVNVLVGERDIWGQGAKEQTSVALINWAFETRDLLWCEATVLSSNRKMLRHLHETGWVVAARLMRPSATDGRPVELVRLRRHRDVWRKDPRSSFITGVPPQTGLASAPETGDAA